VRIDLARKVHFYNNTDLQSGYFTGWDTADPFLPLHPLPYAPTAVTAEREEF